MNWPNPLSNSTPFGAWMNSLLKKAVASELKSVVGGKLTETTLGKVLVIDRQAGGGSGWTFPTAIKYDSSLTYKKHDVVFVDAANTALGQTQAWPGVWVATQDVPVPSAEKHYPNVQYNPDSASSPVIMTNFDSTNNYWMPVGENCFQFLISTISNADYVKAKLYDGTTLSSVEFTIAKPKNLRTSVSSEVIDGVTINYSSYTSDNTRTASDGTNSEYQVVCPRYLASGSLGTALIKAALVLNGTGVTVSSKMIFMEEVKPFRVWARRYTQ